MEYYTNDGIQTDLENCDYIKLNLKGRAENDRSTLISKNDLPLVINYDWYLGKDGYPVAFDKKYGRIKLHRLLMPCPKGMVVDHINHDRCDNRRINLRICTPKENSYNHSKIHSKNDKYKGVRKLKDTYNATISKDGKRYEIKGIQSEKEAAKIYDMMAEELFGEYAGKNFN